LKKASNLIKKYGFIGKKVKLEPFTGKIRGFLLVKTGKYKARHLTSDTKNWENPNHTQQIIELKLLFCGFLLNFDLLGCQLDARCLPRDASCEMRAANPGWL